MGLLSIIHDNVAKPFRYFIKLLKNEKEYGSKRLNVYLERGNLDE